MEETNGFHDPWVESRNRPGSAPRRTFILSLLATIMSACGGPTTTASAKREADLLDEAAALSQRISVDLIAHAGPFAPTFPSPRLPEIARRSARICKQGSSMLRSFRWSRMAP